MSPAWSEFSEAGSSMINLEEFTVLGRKIIKGFEMNTDQRKMKLIF